MATALVVQRDEPYGKSKYEVIQAYHDFLKANHVDQQEQEAIIQKDLYDIAHLCPLVTYKVDVVEFERGNKPVARFVSRVTGEGRKHGSVH